MAAMSSLHDVELAGIQAIRQHELFARLDAGVLTSSEYVAYLREMYHLVKHTPLYLKIAADRVGGSDPSLRDFFLAFAEDETGHELLCVHDLRVLGADPEAVLADAPGHGAWTMIAQNYYLAAFGDATALLGDTVATEGLGASLADAAAKTLIERCGVAATATTFLRVHGQADVEHAERSRTLCERYGDGATSAAAIVHACRMTMCSYLRLCDDVLACAPVADSALA